jgi:hypothetical protein
MSYTWDSNALDLKIPQEGLKLIACLTMLTDHIGAIFFPTCAFLRIIGRISYPIYAFLIAEGVGHSRDLKKYGLRLLLIALLTELPYDLLFSGAFTWSKNSVMVTLLLGFGAGVCMKGRSLWMQALCALPFILLSRYCNGTYGMYGLVMIVMFCATRNIPFRLPVQLVLMVLLGLRMAGFPARVGTQIFAIASMLPIALYSGKKRSRNPVLQWGFTLFYPLHIVILLLIRLLCFK